MKPVTLRLLTFLGTSSGAPTLTRNVSSYCVSLTNGDVWMFDAGEGTQHQLQRCESVSVGRVSKIFITHMHGDHCFGLPGLMASISPMWRPPTRAAAARGSSGNCSSDDGTDEEQQHATPTVFHPFSPAAQYLDIYGPPRLGDFLRSALQCSETHFGFKYRVHEVLPQGALHHEPPHQSQLHPSEAAPVFLTARDDGVFTIIDDARTGIIVHACPLDHRVFCLGYVLREADSPGALDVDAALRLGVPRGPQLAELKAGRDVTVCTASGNVTVRAADVVGPTQPGRCAVLLGDTCNSNSVLPLAQGANWLVHEATFDDAHEALAVPRGHSTARMAGAFAQRLGVGTLLLTHFSARYPSRHKDPAAMERLEAEARSQFSGTVVAVEDFMAIDLSTSRRKAKGLQ